MIPRRFDLGHVHLTDRRLSRRAVLRTGAAGLAATLVAAGLARGGTAAQDATPSASPEAGVVPDLTEVTPLPLSGERLATFEAYIAAKLAELGVPGAAVAVVQGGEVA